MRHLILVQVVILFILGLCIPKGYCQFSSFKEIDLGDDGYLGRDDRSGDFYGDDDVDYDVENVVEAPYKYAFNVVDDEQQVYQQQKQQREKGVVSGEYSWIDGVGTRHVVVYRADDTGYHVLEMRQEKNVIKIKERKPRKPKKNGSRRAKVTALRASKLSERGWQFNDINNKVTKVLKPVSEKTSVLRKVKRVEIPELVRSFTPTIQNSLEAQERIPEAPKVLLKFQRFPLDGPIKPKSVGIKNNQGNKIFGFQKGKLVSKDAVPNNDFLVKNRPFLKPEINQNIVSDFNVETSLPLLGNKKDAGSNNFFEKGSVLRNTKNPSLNIIDLIPTSEDDARGTESIIPNQPNHRVGRPQLTSSKTNFLNLIPITESEGLKNKNQQKSLNENIELVTSPPINSPRPRIFLPILTKNEREKPSLDFNQGVRKSSPRKNIGASNLLNPGFNEPDTFITTGKPPVVISTTRLPVDTNIPNPIFNEKTVETSLADAQQKKEDEIIAQIRKQLYEVLGQKRKESKLSGSKNQGNKNKISSHEIAGILTNIGISPFAPKFITKNVANNKEGKKVSKVDKRKKKIRIVKSRPRLRKPPPTFANFGLVELNKSKNKNKGQTIFRAKIDANSLLKKIPGISGNDAQNSKNPNRKRKLLRVIKKLRPKKFRNFQRDNKDFRASKGSFDSPILKSLLSNTQNSLDSGVNSIANKVLLQAVLETENNVGGDVEESVRSQIFITPKSLPTSDVTISRVEKVGPNTATQQAASATLNEVSTRKIVLPTPGSVQLRQTEIRSSNDGSSRQVYTLPPKVLQPIGFVHPTFSL